MTVAEMISALQDHGFDDASAARLLEKVNTSYWDLCARQPWPFLEKTIALTFAGGSATASNFPSDFRAAQVLVTTSGVTGVKLKRIRYDDWLIQYGDSSTTAGTPQMYYMIGNTMNFYPVPPSTIVVTMMYLQQPAALTALSAETAVVVPVPFHPVIVDGALFKLYAMEDDTDIAPTFETYFERGIQNMTEFCWRKTYDGNDTVHAVDSDDLGLDSSYFGYWNN